MPWDYKGPSGANLINGKIVQVFSPQFLIFESEKMLEFDGNIGRLLILKPRYEKQVLTEGNSYEGTVGGWLLSNDEYKNKTENFLEQKSKYVLIGSLKKI